MDLFKTDFFCILQIKDSCIVDIENRRGGHYKKDSIKRLSFFRSIKAYVKRFDVAYFWFRVQKYAVKGGFPTVA